MRILIVGAGLGGLLANALLRRRGFQTVLIDRAAALGRGGYVLALWRVGVRPLEQAGLGPAVTAASRVVTTYAVTDERGGSARVMDLQRLNARHGPLLQLHRSRLQQILSELPESRDARLSTSIEALAQDPDGVSVRLTDGAVERFDLIVGADGVRSAVRRLALPERAAPAPFGAIGWAFLAPADADTPEGIVELWGRGRYVGVYRHAADRCGVYGALADDQAGARPPAKDRRLDLLRAAFSGFGGCVPRLLSHLPAAAEVFHHTLDEVRVPTWTAGRVVLLGDAAHAMLPFGGMGASMAFEDAAVLAAELAPLADGRAPAAGDAVAAALRRYQRRRGLRVRSIQLNARLKGQAMLRGGRLPLSLRAATAIAPDPLLQYDSYQERVLDYLLSSSP